MSFENMMSKVRYWDNILAKWMMRHFYVLFFQIVLVIIFFGFFANTLKVIDVSALINDSSSLSERMMFFQTVSTLLILSLILLNSFWILFMFNTILRMQTVLRDISYLCEGV